MRSHPGDWISFVVKSGWLIHSIRTAVAAVVSLLVARLFTMPEAYWAPVSTLIVMQSTLGAAWTVSKSRLIGTALGAGLGGLLGISLQPQMILFGLGILILGVVCGLLRLQQSAFRFAGITFTIVVLVSRLESPPIVAVHRFVEVSIGIAVAIAMTWLWPGSKLEGDRL